MSATEADLLALRALYPDASPAFFAANGLEAPAKAAERKAAKVKADRAMRAMTEAEFQAAVIELAELRGWEVFHVNDSRGQKMDDWPDLVLVRDRVLYRELKRLGKWPTPGQERVLDKLRRAGADAEWWTPNDWGLIEATLA